MRYWKPLLAAFAGSLLAPAPASAQESGQPLLITPVAQSTAGAPGVSYIDQDRYAEEVLEARGVVVVTFTAEWCRPCQNVRQTLSKLAAEYQGRVTFRELNVDDNAELALNYNIRNLPAIRFYKDGSSQVYLGQQPEAVIREQIDKLLRQ
ncbi:MAG: thioredoxin family protein [Erythrobacter sp.]|nr:thioredoxin family protein [Erythrobacter sp.]